MDWDKVTIIRSPNAKATKTEHERPVKKQRIVSNKEIKIENLTNEGDFSLNLVPLNISKYIIQRRQELGLTQKELANKINQNIKVVQDFESGKAKMDGTIIAKLNRVLDANLRKI